MTMLFLRRLSVFRPSAFLPTLGASSIARIVMMTLLAAIGLSGSLAVAEEDSAPRTPAVSTFADPSALDRAMASDRVRGQIISRHRVVLSSEIAGRVISLPFREGDSFKKDDILIRLDCAKHQAQRDEAAAEFDQADAVLRTRQDLAKHKSTSELELITAENDYRRASSKLEMQNAFVGNCRIVAPFDGSVIARGVAQHQFVDASEPMLEILDPQHLEVELLAPSSWLTRLTPDNTFTIRIDENGTTYKARIVRVVPSIDPVSQSIRIFAKPETTKDLLPGMSGWVSFEEVGDHDDSPSETNG